MFSGIIENKGTVREFTKFKDYRLVLDTDLKFRDIMCLKRYTQFKYRFIYKIRNYYKFS